MHTACAGASAIAPQCRFCGDAATVPPAAPSFLSQEKRWWRKECLGTRNSADAQKSILLHCAYYRFSFRSPNALRVTRPILYTGISHRGKYLTYGNREIFVLLRVVGADAHISPLHSGSMWASTPTNLLRSDAFRFPYVKYSTGANGATTQFIVRSGNPILRSPEGRSLTTGVTTTRTMERYAFSRVSAISRPAPLFCILFSGKTEKSMPPEAQLRCHRNHGTAVQSQKP